MKLKFNLGQKVLALVCLPLLFELVFIASLAVLLYQAEHEVWKERHAKTVIADANTLTKNFMDASMLLVLYSTTHRKAFLDRQEKLMTGIPAQFEALKLVLSDSKEHEKSLSRLETICNRGLEILTYARKSVILGGGDLHLLAAKKDFGSVSAQFVSGLSRFVDEQKEIEAVNPQAQARVREMITVCLIIGTTLSIVLAVVLAVVFNRGTTRRLNVLLQNTRNLAEDKELVPELGGTDEIAELDAVFHQMADGLQEAARRKREMMSMVSHDLRAPLTSINVALRLLASGSVGDMSSAAGKQLALAEKNSNKLIELINDLLDIERLESGTVTIQPEEVRADAIIKSSAESVYNLMEEKEIKLETESDGIDFFADPKRLEQVVTNLLSNAIKFSPEKSTIKVQKQSSAEYTEFKVSDQGRGIPEGNQSAIFERFSQVRLKDAERGKGTGLGLPICKLLVEAHGGTIGVESREGEGSTFWFRVPEPAGEA